MTAEPMLKVSAAMMAKLLNVSEAAVVDMFRVPPPAPPRLPVKRGQPVGPPGPLPPVEDRAAAIDVSERYAIPLSTVYDLMNGGELPSWPLGRKKRCTSWRAARSFFEGAAPPAEAG